MRGLLAALAMAFLLAGCASPAAPPAMVPSSSASLSSTAATMGMAPAPQATRSASVQWTGHTKEGAWVCPDQSGVGHCTAGQQVQPDGQFLTMVGYRGNLTALSLTMTWSADPTQLGGLTLAAFGNTTSGLAPLMTVSGQSPLKLVANTTAAGLVADGEVMLMVWPQGKTPTSPSVFVDLTQQEFTVEGTLTSLA